MTGVNVMISGRQSRAARAYLEWSLPDVRDRTGLSVNTIGRFEQLNSARTDTLRKLAEAFVKEGIEFPDDRTIRFPSP